MDTIDALRGAGFSEAEIGSWQAATTQTLSAAGFSPDEINGYVGKPIPPQMPLAGEGMDDQFSSGSMGQILDWFGQGFKQSWGAAPDLSQETNDALKLHGWYNDWHDGTLSVAKAFNEAVTRPAVWTLDKIVHAVYGTIGGVANEPVIGSGLQFVSDPGLQASLQGLGPPGALAAGVLGVLRRFGMLPTEVAKAADLAVISRSEAAWKGLAEPADGEQLAALRNALTSPEPAPGSALPAPTMRGKPETAYVAVPPAPQRLAEFLRQAGGVQDEGGELSHILGDMRTRPGLVNGNGMPLDDAALAAHEAGYFPETADRPSENDLLVALEQDLKGQPRYSGNDAEAAALHDEAVAHNAEIDRLGNEMGIDPRDYTRDQFLNLAAEHVAGQQLEHDQASLGDALSAERDEDQQREAAFAESRGDAWEPAAVAGRSMEDLERLQSEPAPGALRTEPPASPSGPFERLLVDKAGNIRLDNLNQPEDVDAAIRQAAARNNDFVPFRRGTLSDGEVLDLAEATGRDPSFLDRKAIGDAFNAEEVMAARQLLVQQSTRVRDLMPAAAGGDDAAVLRLGQEIERLDMIQGKVAQATAEWGRAGRSFRALMEGAPEADQLSDFLKANTGRTKYELMEMAQLGQMLRSPAQLARFLGDMKGGQLKRAIVYYWINSLISGPITHARYSVGNAINALATPLIETPIAAGIGAARRALGVGSADRVYLGEAGAQLFGLARGTRDGVRAMATAFKTGISPALPGEAVSAQFLRPQVSPIPGIAGKVIGVPARSVAAIHSFFKAVRYEQNIQALAYRRAMTEGREGDAFNARIASLTQRPSEAMMEEASRSANKELYLSPTEFTTGMGALSRFVNNNLIAKIMVPFLKIGAQITRNALIERTPLGVFSSEVRGNLLSGAAAGDVQAAKISVGVGLSAMTVLMAAEGLITGDGPIDPNQRAVWLLNHRPNTIQIGDVTIPYQGLGHLGMLMRLAANTYETAHAWKADDGEKLAEAMIHGFGRAVLDENFLRGLHTVLDAVYEPEEHGGSFLRSFTPNWLPFGVGLGQAARAIDPVQRQQNDTWDAIKAHIPFVSEALEPRRDRFGEPIPHSTGLPQRSSYYANDRTVQALEGIGYGIGQLKDDIRGVKLDPSQYDDLARIAGRYTKLQLDQVTRLLGFSGLPDWAQKELVEKIIAGSRETARAAVMMQNPSIISAAVAAKTHQANAR